MRQRIADLGQRLDRIEGKVEHLHENIDRTAGAIKAMGDLMREQTRQCFAQVDELKEGVARLSWAILGE